MTCLVAVDGTEGSRSALRWADRHAAAVGERLCVLQAWEYPSATVMPGHAGLRPADEVDAVVAADLRDVVADEVGSSSAQADHRVERGPADYALLHAAREIGATCIVMGKRGLGAVTGRLLGSVSRHVAEHAPCPVVIVPPGWDATEGPILVGLDASANASAALRWAADVARATGSTLITVHAYSPPPRGRAGSTQLGGPNDVLDGLQEEAQAMVDELCTPISSAGVSVHTVVAADDPRHLIDRVAADTGARLVVVGARGEGPIASMLLGSAATYLIQHCERPVAIVNALRP